MAQDKQTKKTRKPNIIGQQISPEEVQLAAARFLQIVSHVEKSRGCYDVKGRSLLNMVSAWNTEK